MTIDFKLNRLLGSGVYGDVFEVGTSAFKLFRSKPIAPPRQTPIGRKRLFECQCQAFKIAASHSWLREHTASFEGTRLIEDVLDQSGRSIRSEYLLECCYETELFPPRTPEAKAGANGVRSLQHIELAIQQFSLFGIDALDASIFDFDDPARFKFIDIQMKNCH